MSWWRRILRSGHQATELSTARTEMHLYREERDEATRELTRWQILGAYAQDVEKVRGQPNANTRAWDVIEKLSALSRGVI
jgi:hypothetical protein